MWTELRSFFIVFIFNCTVTKSDVAANGIQRLHAELNGWLNKQLWQNFSLRVQFCVKVLIISIDAFVL